MTKIRYVDRAFSAAARKVIAQANEIIDDFEGQGFTLTLRQLYYQFVGKALIPNTQQSYKRLGSIINDARLAGLIDWEAIEDRTRFVRQRSHWEDPAGVIESAARGYGIDLWKNQKTRVEVWIEKDALVGVLEGTCRKWDVPLISCRGYSSQSELWRAAERHKEHDCGMVVLHFGDHDPSGLDMTRDVQNRLEMFGAQTMVMRLALSIDQVKKHKLPPNPAKVTDSRFEGYEAEHGASSWELDAMSPKAIVQIAEQAIAKIVDADEFAKQTWEQETGRDLLKKASKNWPALAKQLGKTK